MTFVTPDRTPRDLYCAVGPNRESTDQNHKHLMDWNKQIPGILSLFRCVRKEESPVGDLRVADVCVCVCVCVTCWNLASNLTLKSLQDFDIWYIANSLLHTDLQLPTVRDEIIKFITNYRAKLFTHPNELTSILVEEQGPGRLKRFRPTDFPTRCS
jgi:hypothetical protein